MSKNNQSLNVFDCDCKINYDAEVINHTHAFDLDGYCLVCALNRDELLTMSGVVPDGQ